MDIILRLGENNTLKFIVGKCLTQSILSGAFNTSYKLQDILKIRFLLATSLINIIIYFYQKLILCGLEKIAFYLY